MGYELGVERGGVEYCGCATAGVYRVCDLRTTEEWGAVGLGGGQVVALAVGWPCRILNTRSWVESIHSIGVLGVWVGLDTPERACCGRNTYIS